MYQFGPLLEKLAIHRLPRILWFLPQTKIWFFSLMLLRAQSNFFSFHPGIRCFILTAEDNNHLFSAVVAVLGIAWV